MSALLLRLDTDTRRALERLRVLQGLPDSEASRRALAERLLADALHERTALARRVQAAAHHVARFADSTREIPS